MLLIVLAALMTPAWTQVHFSEDFTIQAPAFTSAVNDGVNIWLNHPDSQTISAVDSQTGNCVFQIRLNAKGENLAFDGRHLLLTQDSEKKVMAIDRATGRVQLYLDLKTITGDRDPLFRAVALRRNHGHHCWQRTNLDRLRFRLLQFDLRD